MHDASNAICGMCEKFPRVAMVASGSDLIEPVHKNKSDRHRGQIFEANCGSSILTKFPMLH